MTLCYSRLLFSEKQDLSISMPAPTLFYFSIPTCFVVADLAWVNTPSFYTVSISGTAIANIYLNQTEILGRDIGMPVPRMLLLPRAISECLGCPHLKSRQKVLKTQQNLSPCYISTTILSTAEEAKHHYRSNGTPEYSLSEEKGNAYTRSPLLI